MATDANITVLVHSLFKGSRNPPVDVQILLRTVRGDWGIGTAYLHGGRMYFNFYRPGQAWLGEHKAAFTAWMLLPQLPAHEALTDPAANECNRKERTVNGNENSEARAASGLSGEALTTEQKARYDSMLDGLLRQCQSFEPTAEQRQIALRYALAGEPAAS